MPLYISPPPQNPLARVFAAIIAAVALAGAFMLGLVALAVIIALGVLVWLGVWLRISWLRRRFRRSGAGAVAETAAGVSDEQIIEAEYTVISRNRDS